MAGTLKTDTGAVVASRAERRDEQAGEAGQTGVKTLASSTMSKVAWIPRGELAHGEWMAAGRRLGAIGRCSQWWVGDWIRYGTTKWGEKYAEAARVTGYDVASLRNMAWVASRFDLSLRSDKLTWSHHVLLAPLPVDEQKHWIARASEEKLSVADLRIELRAQERAEASDEEAGAAAAQAVVICPHCGHEVPLPE
jgi:hypothetical protein